MSHGSTVLAEQTQVEIEGHQAQLVTFSASDKANGQPLTWQQVAQRLVADSDFRILWNQTWADLSFDFEWKPVPIHPYTAETHPFFAIAFPARFRPANPQNFQRYLQDLKPGELTAAFDNFSGDAQLLIPANTGDYGHIGAFCRTAERKAREALWQKVGELCMEAIAHKNAVWCNTHGHGVPWLHVRFDSRLKYSVFPPRDNITANSQAIWYERIYEQAQLST